MRVRVWPVLICDHGDGVEAVLVSVTVILCLCHQSAVFTLRLDNVLDNSHGHSCSGNFVFGF